MATLSGTGSSITYTDEFTQAPSVPRQFHRAKTVLTPNGNLANTTLSITQTWEQQPSGYARTAVVQVPAGAGPHPVIILLHGNGGTGAQMIGALDPHVSTAIRVAPSGYLTSWNVDGEASRAPDVAFIRDLIAMLKTYDNVDAGKISIFGISNGSGMTNRLLIELDGAAFQNAGCQVSQMLAKMYHDGAFWFNATGSNAYDQIIMPAKRRRIISLNGTADPLIPYTGGTSAIGTFISAQESIYRFAQAMGETGPQLADAAGIPGTGTNGYSAPFVKYTYRSGQFVHYKLIGGNHGLQVSGSFVYADEAKQLVAAFLLQ
jgi:poly(3-hydroxybutyrate) depolymerase